jgi:hypothetical protein
MWSAKYIHPKANLSNYKLHYNKDVHLDVFIIWFRATPFAQRPMRKTSLSSLYYYFAQARFNRLSGWLIILFVLMPVLIRVTTISSRPSLYSQSPTPVNCREMIDQYTNDELVEWELADPIITDQTELDAQIQKYTFLRNCLDTIPEDQYTNELNKINKLVDYFLIFAGGDQSSPGDTKVERIDLTISNDPAVIKLRDEIGIPPPPGWIFIRYYPNRQAMPEQVQYAFENPQVAGVTILSKYIAIIKEPSASWAESALQNLSIPNILSHELVHAYVNSVLAKKHLLLPDGFPRWFVEGLASHISHSDRPHSIITQTLSFNQTATDEYQRFVLIFKYLENRLGQKGLDEKIRQALEVADASKLYADLGIKDDRWLEITVNEWQKQRVQKSYFFGLFILGATFAGLYWFLPELECSCGFAGRQRDFIGGKCPDCGKPTIGAHRRSPIQSTFSIYPECQVCGRRFLPWQRYQLHQHKRLIRIWVESPLKNERPLVHHLHRVCFSCLANSQDIAEEYRRLALEKFDLAGEKFRPIYQEWLEHAPLFNFDLDGLLEMSLEQAVDEMILAAISPDLVEWLNTGPLFRLTDADLLIESGNDILPPPQKYDRILVNVKSGLIGSVYQASDHRIIIYWEF